MRIIFAGTPEFAVPSLEAVVDSGHEVQLVLTQPDRPRGRGMALTPPPVKEVAAARGLNVAQPERLDPDALARSIVERRVDALVVVAYAHKIPPVVLAAPRHGCINVHASLLPRWRGAAPVAWAILDGDRVAGVTTMRMDEGWDTGPVFLQRLEPIRPDDTAQTLHDRLALHGAGLLVETLRRLELGLIRPITQPPTGVRMAPRLTREQAWVDWEHPAARISRQVRAFAGWPGTCTVSGERALKLIEAEPAEDARAPQAYGPADRRPGEIVAVETRRASLIVACGHGTLLRVVRVQPEGGRVMTGAALANGWHLRPGDRFGTA